MMKYLTRPSRKVTEEKARKELKLPKDTKLTGSKMLNWINYNNKMFGDNKQPVTAEELKIAADVEKSLNKSSIDQRTDTKEVKRDTKVTPKKDKWTYESWAEGLEERTRPAEKAPVAIVKKPKPVKPLKPVEPFYDWRFAPWWLYPSDDDVPPPEDKTEVKTGITKLI